MNSHGKSKQNWSSFGTVLKAIAIVILAFGYYTGFATADDVAVTLHGDQEVPPVETEGSGSGLIVINADKTVSGSLTTTGIDGTMAHIHEAAPGKNGPPIITLAKERDTYTVPRDTKLTDAQFASFKAGNLYINVHTAEHPNGEIRGQLEP